MGNSRKALLFLFGVLLISLADSSVVHKGDEDAASADGRWKARRETDKNDDNNNNRNVERKKAKNPRMKRKQAKGELKMQ